MWGKLALLHFQDFDSAQLHAEPRLLKVLNGFPSIGATRKGWRLARNDILPAACRMLCNINDEYVASGKHPSNIYVTFEDVVSRMANWRNNPFFDRFTLRPLVLARRRPFTYAPDTDVVLDPSSPSICTDMQNSLKFRPFESVPLDLWVSLDGLSSRLLRSNFVALLRDGLSFAPLGRTALFWTAVLPTLGRLPGILLCLFVHFVGTVAVAGNASFCLFNM